MLLQSFYANLPGKLFRQPAIHRALFLIALIASLRAEEDGSADASPPAR